MKAEIQHKIDLGWHLFGRHEMVGVILGETAHAQQSVQHTAAFVAVNCAHLGKAHRHLAVGAHSALVDMNMEGAVHRFEEIFLPFNVDRRIHVLAVVTQMTAGLPQRSFADVGGIDEFIANPVVFRPPEILHRLADASAVGMPKDQPCADLLHRAVQVQFTSQLAVVTFLGFFQQGQVILQFLG